MVCWSLIDLLQTLAAEALRHPLLFVTYASGQGCGAQGGREDNRALHRCGSRDTLMPLRLP